MMRKFRYLLGYSLKNRFCKKGFIIGQVVMLILLCLIMNIGNFVSYFGGDFEDGYKVALYNSFDETNEASNMLIETFDTYYEEELVTFKLNFDLKDEDWDVSKKDELLEDYDLILLLNKGEKEELTSVLFADSFGLTERTILSSTLTQIRNYFITLGMDQSELENLEILNSMYELDVHFTEGEDEDLTEGILGGLSMFIIFPIFFLIIMVVQMVGMEIIEEKSTRSIEYIISNISPTVHFFSKTTSAIIWAASQVVLMFVYSLIGLLIATLISGVNPLDALGGSLSNSHMPEAELTIFNNLLNHIPQMLLVAFLFVLFGFILYIVYTALLSSISSSSEQFQQAQSPLMLSILLGFYIGMFGMLAGGSAFVKVCGYVPVFAPMLAPMLFMTGQYSILEVIISLVILIITTGLSLYFVLPLYKSAILSYSEEKFFSRIKKVIQNTKNEKKLLKK